jgi:2-aminoadipate transaminase
MSDMHLALSRYGRASTRPSPVNCMMSSFACGFRDDLDINLGVGYVNEATIPVGDIEAAMHAVAADPIRYRQAFNYGSSAGSPNLIHSLRRFLGGMHIGGLDATTLERKQLIIGPCGATSVLDALTEILARGIVVTSDPMYYIYCDVLDRKGFEVVAVPENAEGIDMEILERDIQMLGEAASQIAFFYIPTVNNPSCTILSNGRRRALLEFAADLSRKQNRRIPIFFDLAYELLLHDPNAEPFRSVLPEDEMDLVYEIGTLSKVLAPALRIGYLLGPGGPVMNAMAQKTSDAGFSAPLFVQEMASYLLDHCITDQLKRVNSEYRRKADAVRDGIRHHFAPFLIESRGGSAGFYYYLTFEKIETHSASRFFRFLARSTGDFRIDGPNHAPLPRVIYLPGEYCVHPSGHLAQTGLRQMRISYAFETLPQILRALSFMGEAISRTSKFD